MQSTFGVIKSDISIILTAEDDYIFKKSERYYYLKLFEK